MPMRTKIRAHWARIRVLFTLMVALAILFTLMYLLSGGGLFKSRVPLYSYFEDSGGMEPGAVVLYNGVQIGKVDSVRLSHLNDPHRTVVVRLEIDLRYISQIPADSKTEIVTENFLGDKHIEIDRGKSPTPIQPNAEMAHKPATNVYIRIDLTTFAAQLRNIDAVLKDIQEGKGGIGQFVMGEQMYKDLLTAVKTISKQIETVAGTKTTLGDLLYKKDLYESLSVTFRRLDATLAEMQAGRGATGKLLRDPAAYDDLRKQAADVRKQVEQIGNTELMKSDALYQSWNQNLKSMGRSVDGFNAGESMTSVQTYESMLGMTHELGNTLHDFRTNPKKFLRLKIF
jgi:phospholipid/cholesterol/gamma-HCH transport system substrate-binding protein